MVTLGTIERPVMQKAHSLLSAMAGIFVGSHSLNSSAQFADSVVAYTPGVGVTSSYTNPVSALGEPSRITPGTFGGPVTPFSSAWQSNQVVSIGEGGSLTLHFNTPITNDPGHPFGLDFIIFGNAVLTITNGEYSGGGITDGTLFGNNAGNTRVSVSADGITFYFLNPSNAPVVDGWFPTEGSGNFFVPVNPGFNRSHFEGKNLEAIRALYAGSGGGSGYDLSWAQDSNAESIALSSVSFIRIEVISGKSEVDGIAKVSPAAITVAENFSSDPKERGWGLFGHSELFRWNGTNQNLEVIWDSSRSNSYFHLPLGTILTRHDDFAVSLDLLLEDIAAGVTSNRPGTFQIAFGFHNSADAKKTNFFRGSSSNSPNLVEFNFFPDTGFGPTVWPGILSTNSAINYNGPGDFGIFDLPVGVVMHISLAYIASNETATISITTNGVLVGHAVSARLATNSVGFGSVFTQFKLDTFAIASYSDEGQNPSYAGSILAHGVIDNLVITFPPPPVQDLHGDLSLNVWQTKLLTRTNWNYVVEATENFRTWSTIGVPTAGSGGQIILQDTNALTFPARFYRINAQRAD
jgi:hypothetical protein